MKLTCYSSVRPAVLGVCVIFAGASSLIEQSPARPAVRVQQLPRFDYATWPVDLNGDGRTDLVGTSRVGGFGGTWDLITALGRGDGTFTEPRTAQLNAA